ncbi:hypothetical protein SRHO_G00020900 [Serrasalmus rhombeus]
MEKMPLRLRVSWRMREDKAGGPGTWMALVRRTQARPCSRPWRAAASTGHSQAWIEMRRETLNAISVEEKQPVPKGSHAG